MAARHPAGREEPSHRAAVGGAAAGMRLPQAEYPGKSGPYRPPLPDRSGHRRAAAVGHRVSPRQRHRPGGAGTAAGRAGAFLLADEGPRRVSRRGGQHPGPDRKTSGGEGHPPGRGGEDGHGPHLPGRLADGGLPGAPERQPHAAYPGGRELPHRRSGASGGGLRRCSGDTGAPVRGAHRPALRGLLPHGAGGRRPLRGCSAAPSGGASDGGAACSGGELGLLRLRLRRGSCPEPGSPGLPGGGGDPDPDPLRSGGALPSPAGYGAHPGGGAPGAECGCSIPRRWRSRRALRRELPPC